MSDTLPPDDNPILKAYESFLRETPLVTRYLLQSQAITWVLSFFVDLPLVVGNVPQFTIYKFEVYRILISPFICPSLFSLIFAFVAFADNGRRMEHGMGSAAFGLLVLTLGIMVNLLHLIVAFCLFGLTGSHSWKFLPCFGIWIIVFGVLSIECAQAPPTSMRRLFFIMVPTRYYPLALLAVFSLLGGFQLPYLLSIGMGVAYQRGYLDVVFKVDHARIQRWEQTILESYTSREGWVSNERRGSGDWSQEESSGGMGLFSSLLRPQQPQQGRPVASSPSPGDPRPGRAIYTGANSSSSTTETSTPNSCGPSFPAGGGRQLGTASRRPPPSDPRQARLEALERRLAAQGNTDDNV